MLQCSKWERNTTLQQSSSRKWHRCAILIWLAVSNPWLFHNRTYCGGNLLHIGITSSLTKSFPYWPLVAVEAGKDSSVSTSQQIEGAFTSFQTILKRSGRWLWKRSLIIVKMIIRDARRERKENRTHRSFLFLRCGNAAHGGAVTDAVINVFLVWWLRWCYFHDFCLTRHNPFKHLCFVNQP